MTDFEKQLIKAIEHGCPGCGSQLFSVKWMQETFGRVEVTKGELAWSEPDTTEMVDDRETTCAKCGEELWTAENGWIPELQEIVKGE